MATKVSEVGANLNALILWILISILGACLAGVGGFFLAAVAYYAGMMSENAIPDSK